MHSIHLSYLHTVLRTVLYYISFFPFDMPCHNILFLPFIQIFFRDETAGPTVSLFLSLFFCTAKLSDTRFIHTFLHWLGASGERR